MIKQIKRGVVAASVLFGTVAANAAGNDYSVITGSVDFAAVGAAVLAIAGLLAVPLVVKKGARMVLSMIGR